MLEVKPLSSPVPGSLSTNPSTPLSELGKPAPETNDSQSGTAYGTPPADSQELSAPGTPNPACPSRPKPRQKTEKDSSEHSSKVFGRFQPCLVLENSGSVARDHLASERTFLAYIRTSLLLATTGVVLVQLFAVASTSNSTSSPVLVRIRDSAAPLGATLVAIGLLVLALGVRRYFLIQSYLTKGLFPVTRLAAAGITIVFTVVIVVIFGVLVSTR